MFYQGLKRGVNYPDLNTESPEQFTNYAFGPASKDQQKNSRTLLARFKVDNASSSLAFKLIFNHLGKSRSLKAYVFNDSEKVYATFDDFEETSSVYLKIALKKGVSWVYLLVEDNHSPLHLSILPERAASKHMRVEAMFANANYAIILALFAYSIFLYLKTGLLDYIYYVTYGFFLLLSQLNISGWMSYYIREIFELKYSYFDFRVQTLLSNLTPGFSGFSALWFLLKFSDVRKYSVKLERVFRFISYLILFSSCAIVSFFGLSGVDQEHHFLLTLNGKVTGAISIVVCIILMWIMILKYKSRTALISFLAFLPMILLTFYWIKIIGDLSKANIFTYHASSFGVVIEMILFSIGLGDKIQTRIAREKEKVLKLTEDLKILNKSLESKVYDKTKDIQSILDNITQGVVTISMPAENLRLCNKTTHLDNRNLEVQSISASALHILGLEKALSCFSDFTQYLASETSLCSEEVSMLRSIFEVSLGAEELQFDVNSEVLPRELIINKSKAIVELSYTRIVHEGYIAKILICALDVTQLRKLKKAQLESEKDLDILIKMTRIGQRNYKIYRDSVLSLLQNATYFLETPETISPIIIDDALRNLHTIKGLSRNLDLCNISSIVHESESVFQLYKKSPSQSLNRSLLSACKQVKYELDHVDGLAQQSLGWQGKENSILLETDQLKSWYQCLQSFSNSALSNEREKYDQLCYKVRSSYAITLRKILDPIFISSEKLGEQLGKGKINFYFIGEDLFIKDAHSSSIESIFTHLLRNSIDHGVPLRSKDDPMYQKDYISIDLQTLGKNDSGEVSIRVRDTGPGIDLSSLRRKAKATGMTTEGKSPLELAYLIFEPGLSTKAQLTNISGRGIGLDAVKNELEKSGSKIEIVLTNTELGEQERLEFEFLLKLDKSLFD